MKNTIFLQKVPQNLLQSPIEDYRTVKIYFAHLGKQTQKNILKLRLKMMMMVMIKQGLIVHIHVLKSLISGGAKLIKCTNTV